jgi:hypothetical protein
LEDWEKLNKADFRKRIYLNTENKFNDRKKRGF